LNLHQIFGGNDSTALFISLVSAIGAVGSTFVALIAIRYGVVTSERQRADSNTWSMYEAYNSEAVRLGRVTAREATKSHLQGFASQADYSAYFDEENLPKGFVLPPEVSPKQMQVMREQSMHDLMAFYHQVGLLLLKHGLDKDFTLMLIGGGLSDRWPVLGMLPGLWATPKDYPYGGMFVLYRKYLHWQRWRLPWLRWRYERAQSLILQAPTLQK
jgi:hypothetical protein